MIMTSVRRNAPCPCGSELKYKKCCGDLSSIIDESNDINKLSPNGYYLTKLMEESQRLICKELPKGSSKNDTNVPYGMLMIDDFIDEQLCNNLIEKTELVFSKKATIVKGLNGSTNQKVVENDRKTDMFELKDFGPLINSKLGEAIQSCINEYFEKQLAWFEHPQLLRYQDGGFYHVHADSESWNKSAGVWKRTMVRDFSFILYLNDDFEGGKIFFPNFNFEIKPRKGLLVCFPSDHRFIHKVHPTTAGIRYAIVTWAAIEGTNLIGKPKPLPTNVVYRS